MKMFSKNKRLAICLVMILVFTLMPVNYDIAGEKTGGVTESSTERISEEYSSEEQSSEVVTEAVSTEAVTTETSGEQKTEQVPNPGMKTPAEALKEAVAGAIESIRPAIEGKLSGMDNDDSAELWNDSDDLEEDGLLEESLDAKLADGTANLLDNTTIDLNKLTLEASYKDENGKKQVVNMTTTDTVTLPNDADISMDFRFVIGNGSAVDCSKQYVYQIPDGIRVDVNNRHELQDGEGKSIGYVIISSQGTMTFTFYEDAIKNQPNIPFYVRFAGGFSSELKDDLGKHELSFPTASGQFNFNVDITGSNKEDDEKEPGELKTYKSGTQTYGPNGMPCILWKVEVDLNGRDSLTADVVDVLPEGLAYVPGTAALEGEAYGSTGSVSAVESNGRVTFHIQDSKPNWRTCVTFLTSYDTDIFPGKITNNSGVMVNNTVAVNPENEEQTSVEGSGSVYIKPSVLEKGGKLDVGSKTITWTVTINKDKMNIGGTQYTDIFGTGMDMAGEPVITSGGGSINKTDTGFVYQAPAGVCNDTVVITYQTKVDNISQPNFSNTGKLTGDKYDVSVEANVKGMDLIQKAATSYNDITKQFTWTITVNEAGATLKGAKVTEVFDESEMKLISVSVANADGSAYTGAAVSGKDITLGDISDKKIITVVTQLNDTNPKWQEGGWYSVNNRADLTWDGNTATADANRNFQYKKPDILSKSGEITGNGTVRWTLQIKEPQLKQESIKISDTLPAGMEYVDGTFELMYYTWAWDSSQMMKVTPVYDKASNTLSYEFARGTLSDSYYIDNSFVVRYETRLSDIASADKQGKYTNNASIEVDYEGDVKVTDKATSTVEGVVGGTIGKEASYQGGKDYVDWTVKINEAGYDMSAIKNPIIKDRLADYFDYVSGTLYKIVGGKRQKVAASDYVVMVINNQITVKLPNIGTDSYEFEFRTKFNISDNRLESMTIKNTVEFIGDGYSESVTSDEVKNVSFSSSSAGSVLEKELRIRKVDSRTGGALAGAKFELFYQGISIGTAVSDENGWAVFSGVTSADTGITYTLLETEAPDGYQKNEGEQRVTIYDGQLKTESSGIRYIEHIVNNKPITKQTEFSIYKTDRNALNYKALEGAEFGLYEDAACTEDDLLKSKLTDKNGIVNFSVEYSETAPVTYYVKEIAPPGGYLKEEAPIVYSVTVGTDGTITYNNGQTTAIAGGQTALWVQNTKGEAILKIHKVKKGNESVNLAGARFTIYRDSACTDVVDRQTTDADGNLTFSNLELGRTYYYRETAAPDGYEIDARVHKITVGDGTENVNVTEILTLENEPSLGYIEVTKTDDAMPAKPISGITFALYQGDGTTPYMRNSAQYTVTTDSSGKAVFVDLEYGSYVVKETNTKAGYIANTENIKAVVDSTSGTKLGVINERMKFNIKITKNDDSAPAKPLEGVTFVLYSKDGKVVKSGKTNASGELVFSDIAYGSYYVKETAGIKGYIVSDEEWQIHEADILANNQTLTKTFVNQKENGAIRFTKKGEDAGNLLKGAEFTIYDSNGLKVGEAVSDANGEVIFNHLIYDTYTIRETKAPEDYKLDNTVWTVKVTENTTYTKLYQVLGQGTGVSEIVDEKLELGDRYLSFHVLKMDENYTPLQGARFILSKQEKGSSEWVVLASAVSNQQGKVEFHNIAIDEDDKGTQYKLEEVAAPEGYKLDENKRNKVYTYKEITQLQPLGYDRVGHYDKKTDYTLVPTIDTYKNQQIFGKIRVTKTGLTTLNKLQGAEFTLYKADGVTVYQKADGTPYKAVTDKNGIAMFENLPIGYYVVKETGAPDGYLLNALYTPDVQILDEAVKDVSFKDTPISISVSKLAVGGTVGLEGAELAVYDSQDNLIDSWTTTEDAHRLPASKLKLGETYTLKEIKAPDGYRYANSVKFTVKSDGSLEYKEGDGSVSDKHVIMRDKQLELSIRKVDEGGVNGLVGALLEIIDDATGKPVYSFTSDGGTKNIPNNVLKVPEEGTDYTYYTIREKSAPMEYELAEDIKIAIDKNGKIYLVNDTGMSPAPDPIVMKDNLKTDFYFNKADVADNNRLPGATLTIIRKADNKTIAEWVSGSAPKKITLADGTYILKEMAPPDGYTVAKEEVTFTVETDPSGKQRITSMTGEPGSLSYDGMTLAIRDAAISVRVRKLTEGAVILPGASFDLYQSDASGTKGNKLESFVTTGESTDLDYRNLKLESYYLLVETKAPSGYDIVPPILFYVDEDGIIRDEFGEEFENNLIEVIDSEKKLSIQKVDGATNKALSGVRLMISSKEDADFAAIDWVTDGKAKSFNYSEFKRNVVYTLSEVSTVNGYTYADSVDFMINDEDECVYSNGEAIAGNRIILKNKSFEITIRKMSLKTKKDLAGASLAVKDAEGNIIEQWVSDGSPHKLNVTKFQVSLNNEYVYTLSEVKAPEMYALAQPISFVIDKNGIVKRLDNKAAANNTITMEDEYQGVAFSKKDTGGKEVAGAKLTITSTQDTDFKSLTWESTNTPKNWSMDLFKRNTDYILTEEAAPDGYAYAESITFRIDDNGVIYVNGTAVTDQTVTMVDEVLHVTVAKKIKGTKKFLSGASLSVVREDTGSVVHTWKTKDGAVRIPAKKLIASKGEDKVVYLLKENKAPDGYKVAKDIRFYIDEQGNVYTIDEDDNEKKLSDNEITMFDAKKGRQQVTTTEVTTATEVRTTEGAKTTESVKTDNGAKTGDYSPIAAVMGILFTSVGAWFTLWYYKKKRH